MHSLSRAHSLPLAVSLFWFLASCGSQVGDSEVQWGHLDRTTGGNQAGWFVNILPNESIEICGDRPQYRADLAIRKWAAAVQRADFIQIKPCSNTSGVKWRVSITQGPWSYAYPGTGKIVMGGGGAGPEYAMFHEMGHLWGMCDQYINNCDPNHMGPWDRTSVMGSAADLQLKPDDLVGIKKLADRTDFAANKIWKDFLAQNPRP